MYKTWDPRDTSNTTMWHIYRQWGSWQEVRSMTPDPDVPTSSQELATSVGMTSTLGVTFADPEVTSTKAVSTDLLSGSESEGQENAEEKPQVEAEKPPSEKLLVKTTLGLMKSFRKKLESQKTEIKKHEAEKVEARKRDIEHKATVAKTGGKASFKKKADGMKSEVKKHEVEKVNVNKHVEPKHEEHKKSLLKKSVEKLDVEKRLPHKHGVPKKPSLKQNAERLEHEKRLELKHDDPKKSSLKRSEEKLELEKRLHHKHDEMKKSSLKRNDEKLELEKRLHHKHEELKKSSLKRNDEKLELEKQLHHKHEEPKRSSLKRSDEKLELEKQLHHRHEEPKKSFLIRSDEKLEIEKQLYSKQELKRPSLKKNDEKLELEKQLHHRHEELKRASLKSDEKLELEKPLKHQDEEPKKSFLVRSDEKLELEKKLHDKDRELKNLFLLRSGEKVELANQLHHKHEELKSSVLIRNIGTLGINEKHLDRKSEEESRSPIKHRSIEKPAVETLLQLEHEEPKKSSLKRDVEKPKAHESSLKSNFEKLEMEELLHHEQRELKKSSLKRKTEAYIREMQKPELEKPELHKMSEHIPATVKPVIEKHVKEPEAHSPQKEKVESHEQKQEVHRPELPKLEVRRIGVHELGLGTRPEVEGKVAQQPTPKYEGPTPLINTIVIKKMVTLKRPVIPKLEAEPSKVKKPEVKDVQSIWKSDKPQPEVKTVDRELPAIEAVTLHQSPAAKRRLMLTRNASTGSEFEFLNSHAMRIVRTVGQAFEVCHKLSLQMAAQTEEGNEGGSEKSSDENEVRVVQNTLPSQLEQEMMKYIINSPEKAIMVDSSPGAEVSTQPQTPDDAFLQAQALLQAVTSKPQQAVGTISSPTSPQLAPDDPFAPSTEDLPLSSHHQMQLLRQQLEQQQQQTQVAIAQVHLLKDQLSAETAARIEAQARTHQLLLQNRELLEHINSLVGRLQELEIKVTGMPSSELGMVRAPPQIPLLSDPTTPTPGKVFLPAFAEMEAKEATLSRIPDDATFENTNIKKEQAESPDSGHKEMSSDSLAYNLSQPETNLWYAPMSKLNGTASDTSATNSKRSSTSSTNNNTGVNTSSRPSSASFGTFDHQFSPRPLNTTGVNVHGQEFHLQMKTSVSSSGFNSRTSQSTAGLGKADATTDSAKKVITPAPSQDATSNRLELNVRRATPKLNPPPKITKRITSRSPSLRTDVSTSPDSSNNNYSSHSSTTSETSLNGGVGEIPKRHSRDSARFSATDENLNRESKELNTLPRMAKKDVLSKETADRNMNNLSHSPNIKSSLISAADSTTKLHLSFSDEENTENSEDSGVPPQPQTLDSMTFDEFEALSSS